MKLIRNIINSYREHERMEKEIAKLLCKTYVVRINEQQIKILRFCAEIGINNIEDLQNRFK